MTTTITERVTLLALHCAGCGVLFALPSHLEQEVRRTHATFYCPNGHNNYFPAETEAERYKRLYEQSERRAGANYDRAEDAEKRLRATKGVVTKLRKRIVAGVCPFGCRRHFADLERHVASKHPNQHLEAEPQP